MIRADLIPPFFIQRLSAEHLHSDRNYFEANVCFPLRRTLYLCSLEKKGGNKMYCLRLFVAWCFLVLLAAGGLFAQDVIEAGPQPVTVIQAVSGGLISEGVIGFDERGLETKFGTTLSGVAKGPLTGSLFISMNSAAQTGFAYGSADLTGGTWALTVFPNSVRLEKPTNADSIFGIVRGGSMPIVESRGEAVIKLTITGGTGRFANISGDGDIQGTFTRDRFDNMTFTGTLTITYTPSPR